MDVRQIDSFFNEERAFQIKNAYRPKKRAGLLRFLKLILPSVAAVLIALILVLPSFKKNNSLSEYEVTAPKQGELEKLHVENTTFSMTDAEGKISSFTADLLDETAAGSKIVQMTNPKGKIPLNTKNEFVDVASQVGFYHQNENLIVLKQNVEAVYNEETTVETQEATYDFNKSYGYGNKSVYAYGSWGKLWAEGFAYDKKQNMLYLNGQTKILREDGVLYADKQTIYEQKNNKITAVGHVKLDHENDVLYADKLVMFLSGDQQPKIEKIEAFGNVVIHSDGSVVKGNKGVYLPKLNRVDLEENVSLEKDGHIIYGSKAVSNLETKVSHVVSEQGKKRVSGMINGQKIKRNENEKK